MDIDKQRLIIAAAEDYVRSLFGEDATGHDDLHVFRVRDKALFISRSEPRTCDTFLVELGALLHDVGDHKLFKRNAADMITEFLTGLDSPKELISKCVQIAEEISFKGAGVETKMSTFEGEVIQDADRLDALGAVGIARTFAYGGAKGRPMYRPEIKPERHDSFEEYKKSVGPTINHFYEKLLLLKDQMNTRTGKKMAGESHQFMLDFLDRFYAEWEGRA